MKYIVLLILSLLFFSASSQNFEMEQIEQIWRPRIKADFRYAASPGYKDSSGSFYYTDETVQASFPIRTKLSAGVQIDLTSGSLKDLIKNSIKIEASQVMLNARLGAKQVHTGLDSIDSRKLYNAGIGISGLKLTRKFRVVFYSLNAGFNEEDKTIDQMAIRVNGILGQFHIKGMRKNYYYGLVASYTDGVFAPIPFFGGSQPINQKLSFNYTLPAQISFQYKINNNNSVSTGVTLDGFRYGMKFKNDRINFNYVNLSLFAGYRARVNKTFGFRINAGYGLAQRANLKFRDLPRETYKMKSGYYLEAGFYTFFGKNLFQQIAETIGNSLF